MPIFWIIVDIVNALKIEDLIKYYNYNGYSFSNPEINEGGYINPSLRHMKYFFSSPIVSALGNFPPTEGRQLCEFELKTIEAIYSTLYQFSIMVYIFRI